MPTRVRIKFEDEDSQSEFIEMFAEYLWSHEGLEVVMDVDDDFINQVARDFGAEVVR